MAKYDVKFSCGHVQTVELFGKDKDRHRKIEYFQEHGKCKECYKAEMEETEKSMPLSLTIQLNPINTYPFRVYFTGNTKPVKDDIKALGFVWTDIGEGGMFDLLSTNECMGWNNDFKSEEELKKVIEKVKKAFPEIKIETDFNDVDVAMF